MRHHVVILAQGKGVNLSPISGDAKVKSSHVMSCHVVLRHVMSLTRVVDKGHSYELFTDVCASYR